MPDLEFYLTDGVDRACATAYLASLHKHIEAVQEAGCKLGVSEEQLAAHDRSKFTLEEFPYYARQFHGDAGDPDGFARAWLHHIHANPHHWQHYIFPDGFTPKGSRVEAGVVEMPQPYALEMIADWMGASMAYTGSWDMTDWLAKNMSQIRLHSETAAYVREILDALGYADIVYTHRFAGEQPAADAAPISRLTVEIVMDTDANGQPGWFASVKELPGCMTQAATWRELWRMIPDAIDAWLSVAYEGGEAR